MLYRPPVTRVMLTDGQWRNVRLGSFLDIDGPGEKNERWSFREEETGDLISGFRAELRLCVEAGQYA